MYIKEFRYIIIALFVFAHTDISSQYRASENYKIINTQSIISKNYYFLSLLQNDSLGRSLIENDPVLSVFTSHKIEQISKSDNVQEFLSSIQFSDAEIRQIGARLLVLYESDPTLDNILNNHIYPSGAYCLYDSLDKKDFLIRIWEQDAKGMNHFIDVYGKGVKPKYANIDSIDFNIDDKGFHSLLILCRQYIKDACSGSKVFFSVPLHSVLTLSDINNRYEAIDFEPIDKTINNKAYDSIKKTNFEKYPYSVILVLGAGHPLSKLRLRTAALKYSTGIAPFIVVSGGRVHPFKTIYSEAFEMKKFLMEKCNVPEDVIIMEPHARHTTTNIRNTVRIMFRNKIHFGKGIIVSTEDHIDSISKGINEDTFNKRCLDEMGIIPHKLGKRIDETSVEFYPLLKSLYINPIDPLDP